MHSKFDDWFLQLASMIKVAPSPVGLDIEKARQACYKGIDAQTYLEEIQNEV